MTTMPTAPERTGRRRVFGWIVTGLAAVLVLVALVLPPAAGHITPLALLRIPVEGLLGVMLLLAVPARYRRRIALVGGVLLGVLTVLRILQIAFADVLGRPFDPIFDWPTLGNGVDILEKSIGALGAFGVAAGAVVLAIVLLVVVALSVVRLARIATDHRRTTGRTVAALTVVWLVCLTFSAQLVTPLPVASRSVAEGAYETGVQVWTTVQDQRRFNAQVDASHGTYTAQMLSALQGKDVVIAFVESYGRIALEDPEFAPTVQEILDDGTRRLAAAGFATRSAFLTSPVSGGESWLAHATLQSGLRVRNQYSFDRLIESDRLTLVSAFRRTGWRTVAVQPATVGSWPAERFYGFDRTYADSLGSKSPNYFGFQTPDQYTLSGFQRSEHDRTGRGPVMAEISLVTSHWPWHAIPNVRDWNDLGDGTVFDRPDGGQFDPAQAVMLDVPRMRDGYRRTIEYSLSTLISYVQTYGDDDLVLIFLGDHQPPTHLIGENHGLDVPITIVTRDRDVLERIEGWRWQNGLRPSANAPVWPMESFRDRFLSAFSR